MARLLPKADQAGMSTLPDMPRKPESEPLVLEHVYNPDPESAREAYVRALVHLIEFIVENDEHVDAQDQLVVQ